MADGRVTERRKSQENGCHYPLQGIRGQTGQAARRKAQTKLTLKNFTAPDIAVTVRFVNISSALEQAVE